MVGVSGAPPETSAFSRPPKRLPPSKLYAIWLIYGIYLYFSMWLGTAMGNGPPPLWLNDIMFVTWKDYMMIPLLFVAAGMVVEDRKAVRTLVIITAFSLLMIDRSALMESLSRNFATFDESKRDSGFQAYPPPVRHRRLWMEN